MPVGRSNPSAGAITEAPTYVDGILYVGTLSSEVVAVNVTGNLPKIVNRFKAGNWVWGSPVFDDGVLYFGDLDGTLYALDAKTGGVYGSLKNSLDWAGTPGGP